MNTNIPILKVALKYNFKSLLNIKIQDLLAGAFLHNIELQYNSINLTDANFNLIGDHLFAEFNKNNICIFKLNRENYSAECKIITNHEGTFLTLTPIHSSINTNDIDLREYIKIILDLSSYMQIVQLSTIFP